MAITSSKAFHYTYLGAEWARVAIRNLIGDKRIKIITAIALLLNLISWVGGILIIRFLGNEQAVLHYNIVFGIDLIGDPKGVLLIPVAGLLIILSNLLLAASLSDARDKILSIMFLSVSLVSNFFVVLAIYLIYLINFS